MSIYVFIGPTLPVNEAKDILDAIYLPPVAMGDVVRVLRHKPKAIAIVDGAFETVPSVWHKEILFALSQGVQVLGSSSLGALRAAELHSFGMIGIGHIFEAYRSGILDADDEVAVVHGGADIGYQALSDPLVNIREGLRRAAEMSAISIRSAELLLAVARQHFYPDRSWTSLLAIASNVGVPEREVDNLQELFPQAPNLKRADAIALLEFMRTAFHDGIRPHTPTFDFEPTYYWHALVAFEGEIDAIQENDCVTYGALGRHVRLTQHDRHALLKRALFSFLLFHEAKRCGILPSSCDSPTALLRGTSRTFLGGVETFAALTDKVADELISTLNSRLDFFIASELARTGELTRVTNGVKQKAEILFKWGIRLPKLSDAGIDLQELSDWYEHRFGKLRTSGDAHAQSLGFATWEEFIVEVITEYLLSESSNKERQSDPFAMASAM
jgi:hypothetical protein